MAIKYYNGATNTSYTDTGNWDGASAPSSGDTVIIRSDCANNIAGSDQSAVLLVAFIIQPGFNRDIGSSGTPLIIAADKAFLSPSGSDQWLSFLDGNGAGAVTALDVDGGLSTSAPTTEGLHIKSNTTDTLSPCRVHSGQVNFDEDCNIPTLDVSGGTVYVNDADGLGTANCQGGLVIYAADDAITALNVGGTGIWRHVEDGGAITTATVWAGTFDYRSASTITTLVGRSGDITFANTGLRCTVTNCTLWNADLDVRNRIGTPTFTNDINIYGSGQISGDPGRASDPAPSL